MSKFFQFIKNFRFPRINNLKMGFYALTPKERTVLYVSTAIICISILTMLAKINTKFLVAVPEDGGSITEGIIGTPTLVNPVLAVTEADKDLTALVYSGLMRKMPDGTFIGDLADSYTVSPDGTVYTFILKDNITFQDGTNVTASDVVFTITKIQDPLIKSPRKVQWEGVRAEEMDPKTVVFTLKQPYVSFLDNTTQGILPMHVWNNISPALFGLSSLNIKSVGSGPYAIDSVDKTKEQIPQQYNLVRFKKFALGAPHIKKISVLSYANEKELIAGLKNGDIDQAGGISPSYAMDIKSRTATIETSVLPRMFGIFFNQTTNKIFADSSVRQAVTMSIDREAIINEVLKGYGTAITTPIPNTIQNEASVIATEKSDSANLEQAGELLEKNGWKVGADGVRAKGTIVTTTTGTGKNKKTVQTVKGPATRLSFTITTGDAPELTATANLIKESLAKIGIETTVKIYETGTLNQLIRSRNYEALLFGQIVNHEADLFAFWHSSQRADPGLNVALYNSPAADALLESVGKILKDDERAKKYAQLAALFKSDLPAVFIYSPEYIYAIGTKVRIPDHSGITAPSDRFATVYSWYTNSDMVWKIFTR